MLLDGKKIAEDILDNLQKKVQRTPKVHLGAILIGDNPASKKYIEQKKKNAEKVGISFTLFKKDINTTQKELLQLIEELNKDTNISGYIVQLPLPSHIDTLKILSCIDPKKDVDGFHPENQGKVLVGDTTGLMPCTPVGVMKIFDFYKLSLQGKQICILGQSNIVGKPMAQMCINAGATVISCNADTPDISLYTKNCDILISATGVPELITTDMLGEKTVVIDIGFTLKNTKIYGDTQWKEILKAGHDITPVPGGVGPMTVAMLLNNTLIAHEQN